MRARGSRHEARSFKTLTRLHGALKAGAMTAPALSCQSERGKKYFPITYLYDTLGSPTSLTEASHTPRTQPRSR